MDNKKPQKYQKNKKTQKQKNKEQQSQKKTIQETESHLNVIKNITKTQKNSKILRNHIEKDQILDKQTPTKRIKQTGISIDQKEDFEEKKEIDEIIIQKLDIEEPKKEIELNEEQNMFSENQLSYLKIMDLIPQEKFQNKKEFLVDFKKKIQSQKMKKSLPLKDQIDQQIAQVKFSLLESQKWVNFDFNGSQVEDLQKKQKNFSSFLIAFSQTLLYYSKQINKIWLNFTDYKKAHSIHKTALSVLFDAIKFIQWEKHQQNLKKINHPDFKPRYISLVVQLMQDSFKKTRQVKDKNNEEFDMEPQDLELNSQEYIKLPLNKQNLLKYNQQSRIECLDYFLENIEGLVLINKFGLLLNNIPFKPTYSKLLCGVFRNQFLNLKELSLQFGHKDQKQISVEHQQDLKSYLEDVQIYKLSLDIQCAFENIEDFFLSIFSKPKLVVYISYNFNFNVVNKNENLIDQVINLEKQKYLYKLNFDCQRISYPTKKHQPTKQYLDKAIQSKTYLKSLEISDIKPSQMQIEYLCFKSYHHKILLHKLIALKQTRLYKKQYFRKEIIFSIFEYDWIKKL